VRVLLIGNSHTHVNNIPGLLRDLLEWGTGRAVTCDGCSTDSVSLEWHWKRKQTHDALEQGSFDFVVLQDRSGAPLEDPDGTRTYAGLWCDAVAKRAAVPVLYMTWALADAPQTQVAIAEVYRDVARKHQARLAPVGEAWRRAGFTSHAPPLYDVDGRHAAPAGSVLAAAVLAQTIAPEVPWLMLHSDPPALAGLDSTQVRALLAIAAGVD
jgi:hypothetical protein